MLYRNEIIPRYDPFMLIVIVADRTFAAVLDGLVGQDILGEGLSRIHITAVPLIAHGSRNAGCRPLHIAQIGFLLKSSQCICDLLS